MDDQKKNVAELAAEGDWARVFELKRNASAHLYTSALWRLPEEFQYAFTRVVGSNAGSLAELSGNEEAQNEIVDALLAVPALSPKTFIVTMLTELVARLGGKAA